MPKKAISPASVRLKSTVKIKAVSPKADNPAQTDTVGFVLRNSEAVELATKVLAVCGAENASGDVFVTGKKKDNTVTIIRSIK